LVGTLSNYTSKRDGVVSVGDTFLCSCFQVRDLNLLRDNERIPSFEESAVALGSYHTLIFN